MCTIIILYYAAYICIREYHFTSFVQRLTFKLNGMYNKWKVIFFFQRCHLLYTTVKCCMLKRNNLRQGLKCNIFSSTLVTICISRYIVLFPRTNLLCSVWSGSHVGINIFLVTIYLPITNPRVTILRKLSIIIIIICSIR